MVPADNKSYDGGVVRMPDRRGYFGIGVYRSKNKENIGTLWRSAFVFGASFIFTIGRRYNYQCSDTVKAWRSIPLYNYENTDTFYRHMPKDCRLIGVEIVEGAININNFVHPERTIYLLGAEDSGLPQKMLNMCHGIVVLPGKHCLNVATVGSIIMFDRITKNGTNDHLHLPMGE